MGLHYIGGSVGSLTQRELNGFIFIILMGERRLGPQMIHESDLCLTLP